VQAVWSYKWPDVWVASMKGAKLTGSAWRSAARRAFAAQLAQGFELGGVQPQVSELALAQAGVEADDFGVWGEGGRRGGEGRVRR
jgi:hypothetical protein